jgi:hypothetical protein
MTSENTNKKYEAYGAVLNIGAYNFNSVVDKFFIPQKHVITDKSVIRLTLYTSKDAARFNFQFSDGGPLCFNNSPQFSYVPTDSAYQLEAHMRSDNSGFFLHLYNLSLNLDKMYEIIYVKN